MDQKLRTRPGETLALILALIVPSALLGGAYLSQYGFGLAPCEMCWWQRYPHFAAIGFAAIGFFRNSGSMWAALAALAIAVSGLIGGFHAGVEYGWWEGVTACTASLDGDPMEAIFKAQVIRCDKAPWSLGGISLAGWNFLFSLAASGAIFLLLRSKGTTGNG